MSKFPRFTGRFLVSATVAVLAVGASGLLAQTAPQLLPYTAKLLAGGASNPATFTVGSTCPQAGAPYTAKDTYGDGCLATEVQLGATYGGPRFATVDSYGNVFFGDYTDGLVRRIDAVTGIITAVAGGATATPAKGAVCTTNSTTLSTDILGDGCLGTQVKLGRPAGVVFDAAGDLYFDDPYNYNVREIAATKGFVGYTTLNNSGAGYGSAPTVTFSAPPAGGTTATGVTTISATGVVLGIFITNPGSGYTTAPTITFSTPTSSGGTLAVATATLYASGVPPAGGTLSLIDGDGGGVTSKGGYESNNGTLTSCSQANAVCINPATQGYVDGPEGLAFDPNGNLYIADYYETAILVDNLTTSLSTITGVGIPGGTISKIYGAPSSANTLAASGVSGFTVCVNGSGCGYSTSYAGNGLANASVTDDPTGVSYDLSGNVYVALEYYPNISLISSTTGILTSYAGTSSLGKGLANTSRGPAATTPMGASFDVTADTYPAANIYFPDSTNGFIWRVDGNGKNMYVIGGGGTGACATATDVFGDGCPGLNATFSSNGTYGTTSSSTASGVYGTFVDSYADLFIADQKNELVRELASGTQFGVVGANQPVQNVEIHFAAGDVPSTAVYALVTNPTYFTLGKAVCKAMNSDGTTDCILPITATPPATYGYFSSTLKITSTDGSNNFLLSGIFEPSSKTRTSITATSTACSGSTTYSNTLPTTLTATLAYNGPTAPNGVFNFYVNGSTTPLNSTPIAISNLNPTGAAAYGATFTYTFATAGTYSIAAVYTGDTYYLTSTSTATSITSILPSFTMASTGYQQATVSPGQTGLFSFNVVQNGYTGTIGFTVTGLPANSSYTISPTAVSGAGCVVTNTVALSIITQQQQTVQPGSLGGTGHGPLQMLGMVTGIGLALLIGLRRRRLPMLFRQIGLALAMLLMAGSAVGCGKAVGTILQPATPASPANQPYSIVVTPTTTVGTAPAPVMFSLTVL